MDDDVTLVVGRFLALMDGCCLLLLTGEMSQPSLKSQRTKHPHHHRRLFLLLLLERDNILHDYDDESDLVRRMENSLQYESSDRNDVD